METKLLNQDNGAQASNPFDEMLEPLIQEKIQACELTAHQVLIQIQDQSHKYIDVSEDRSLGLVALNALISSIPATILTVIFYNGSDNEPWDILWFLLAFVPVFLLGFLWWHRKGFNNFKKKKKKELAQMLLANETAGLTNFFEARGILPKVCVENLFESFTELSEEDRAYILKRYFSEESALLPDFYLGKSGIKYKLEALKSEIKKQQNEIDNCVEVAERKARQLLLEKNTRKLEEYKTTSENYSQILSGLRDKKAFLLRVACEIRFGVDIESCFALDEKRAFFQNIDDASKRSLLDEHLSGEIQEVEKRYFGAKVFENQRNEIDLLISNQKMLIERFSSAEDEEKALKHAQDNLLVLETLSQKNDESELKLKEILQGLIKRKEYILHLYDQTLLNTHTLKIGQTQKRIIESAETFEKDWFPKAKTALNEFAEVSKKLLAQTAADVDVFFDDFKQKLKQIEA